VKISDDLNAQTDGDIVQVDSGLMNLVADQDEFAAIVAHELAHIVLEHPRRLTAAHVSRGLFKGFGRSARLFKETENEADRLSVTLMANADYDTQAAVRYWLTYGPQLNDHGGLGSTHLPWQARAKLIAAAVARISRQAPRPIIPAWIDSRTQPLR
jgi:Zn-dependent protease with chaperone function